MPRRPTLGSRLRTATRWPLGIGLTSWRYLWRTTPMWRSEEAGSFEDDGPPPLADGVSRHELQPVADGVGPLFHRRYSARIADASMGAEELVRRLAADPDVVSPSEFASFRKVGGDGGAMRVGDEFIVRMPGPWDGPVRVVEVTPTTFRLATLDGHLEAGQIRFSATDEDTALRFEIESWARSGDRLSDLLYDHLRMAKEVQVHMWTSFIERVVQLVGGRLPQGIEIRTRRVHEHDIPDERRLGHPSARQRLDELHSRTLNFELDDDARFTPDGGWTVDDYCLPLPGEPPGPPQPGGTWEVARRLVRDYEFADPRIIRAVYHPDRPLEERDMLLEARFWGLRFHIGVRIGGVRDETREIDGRPVRIWGWNYRTLEGHFEAGQMDYEVWKWLDDGSVEFRIHRFVRTGEIPNPVVRWGFRLFGRREQVRFARHACRRMARLVDEELARRPRAESLSRAADDLRVAPASSSERTADRLARQRA